MHVFLPYRGYVKYGRFVFAIVSIFSFTSSAKADSSLNSQKEKPLTRKLGDYYLPSFSSPPKEEEKIESLEKKPEQEEYEVRPPSLDPIDIRKAIFNNILAYSNRLVSREKLMEPILNTYAWSDLSLFYGNSVNPTYNLISRINRTTSVLGEAALATLIATPTTDIAMLKERQQVLKYFIDQKGVFSALKKELKNYQEAEQSITSFWTSTDPLYGKEYTRYMDDKFYAKGEDPSNKSAGGLEFKKRFFRDFVNIQLPLLWIFIPPTIASLSEPSSRARKYIWEFYTPYYNIYAFPRNGLLGKVENPTYEAYILPVTLSGLYSWSAYIGIKNYLEYSSVLRNLALRMADLQRLVHTINNIDAIIRANPELEKLYDKEITGIRILLARANESTEIGRLINYLQQLPFKNWSYFFNNAGKLLASYKLFIEHKQIFDDAMYELGLLDAYLSFAILVQESKEYDSKNHYTFVELLPHTQLHKPYIKIVGMWNPFLDAKQAVANDIEMNGAKNNVRTIILTGPNAGGKSIFLTGVTLSVLLAQVVGIAPAQQAILTPFNKINTYIDITDDVATGKSLFMAEVDRAQQHIKTLKSLQENEFSFTIFDEPFSGTNPIEGAAAEYSILESLANYTNSLTVVATHYPIVMLLETKAPNKGFINYKVYITRDPLTKKIQYSYKIVPGRSTQAIAIDILEEQGYDTSMLKRARDIIEHPEHYEATFN